MFPKMGVKLDYISCNVKDYNLSGAMIERINRWTSLIGDMVVGGGEHA